MSSQAISRLLKIVFALMLLLIGAGVWYYAVGRKPKIALSVPISDKLRTASIHPAGPGELLLMAGGKATLYASAGGAAKWSVALTTPAPVAAPAAVPAAKPAAPPSPSVADLPTGEKADQLLAKRTERRFAKLREWSNKLNAKKATLKTPLQIEAYNEEAKKYHAELAEARAEAAPTQKPTAPAPAATAVAVRGFSRVESFGERADVITEGGAILLVHGASAQLLDRETGAVRKQIPLSGSSTNALRGAGCVYAVGSAPDGTRVVTRIALSDGAAQSMTVVGPRSEGRFHHQAAGQPAEPVVEPLRTELTASGGPLLQATVRLVEKKITERVLANAADPSSALEDADKKTATGWGSDAAVYAQALAKDSAREDTGGRERTDESTYEVVLTRPLDPAIPEARATVRGHADVFSTPTLDLVAAGRTLLAFDHSNHKLWETTLASPVSDPGRSGDDAGTTAQPFLEDGGRLYFFDSAFLTAFDLKTGQPAWRLPGEGVRKLQLDGRGALYVSTGGGEFDPIGGGGLPLILKIDAKTGKILWKVEKYQDCFVAGGRVYATRETRNGDDMVNGVFDRSKAIECRWKIYRLSASNGEPQWEWFQTRRPLHIEAEGKTVALLFVDELQLLKPLVF